MQLNINSYVKSDIDISQTKKILVLGSPASGKSTLAKKISSKLNLQLASMDDFYWQSNWQRPNNLEWLNNLKKFLNQKQWILDGNYAEYLDDRLLFADEVIYINSTALGCLWRYTQRAINRAMQQQNKQLKNFKINAKFIKKIYYFNRDIKPKVKSLLVKYKFKEVPCHYYYHLLS